MITKEDFEQWKDGIITQAILRVVQKKADEAKEEFQESAWNGNLDPVFLNSCRATYEMAMIMAEWSFEAFSAESEEFEDVRPDQAAE